MTPRWLVACTLAGALLGTDVQSLYAQNEPIEAPPIARFPKDLARNFVGLASSDNLKPLLVGGLITGAAVIPEQNVEGYFARRGEVFESLGEPGEILGNARVVGGSLATAFLISRTVGRPRFQRTTYELAQGLVINTALTSATKNIVGRERPNGEETADPFPRVIPRRRSPGRQSCTATMAGRPARRRIWPRATSAQPDSKRTRIT